MSIMSLSLHSASSDTVSLISRQTITSSSKQWAAIFDERIYQICNIVHPGLPIEYDAVEHIRSLLQSIVCELVEQRVTSVVEVDKVARKLFGPGLDSVNKDAWDNMQSQFQKHKYFKAVRNVYESQHKLAAFIKETLGSREKERKDREKREIERIATYIYYVCESVMEDVLRLTGNYVKNIRNGERKITFANLDVALNADRALMELRTKLKNEEEAESPGGLPFFADFDDYVAEETENVHKTSGAAKQTYESVASDFLRDERFFIHELNIINVFRRRIESVAGEDDRQIISNLFGNLPDIHEIAVKIERTLEDAVELSDSSCIGMGIWDLAESYEFETYKSYILREGDHDSMDLSTIVINDSINTLLHSEKWAKLFESEDKLFNSSLDGQSFRLAVQYLLPQLLNIPIFHFYQYVEYIGKLARLTPNDEDRTDLNNCRSALMSVRTSIDSICSELHELKAMISGFLEQISRGEKIYNVRRLNEIQSSIDGFSGSPIAKNCAELEKDGDLCMLRQPNTPTADIAKTKKWKTERYVYLFDQLIIFCKRHKSTLKYKDRLTVNSTDVYDVADSEIPGISNCFRLVSRDKSCLPKSFTFICRTFEEKKQWMTALVKVTMKSVLDRTLENFGKEEAKRIPLIIPGPEQYRFAEPDSEENISFEDYTSSDGIPVIKNGTVLKLIERLTYHSYTDSKYQQTFLISYRSFCTPNELLGLLIERFNIPIPNKLQPQNRGGGPLAGRYDTVQSHGLSSNTGYAPQYEPSFHRFRKEYERPVQWRTLSVINQWVKFHWYDFQCDPSLLETLEAFLNRCCDPKEKFTKQHKAFCTSIFTAIEKKKAKASAGQHPLENGERINFDDEGHTNVAFVYGEENQQQTASVYTNEEKNENAFGSKRPDTLWHTAQKGDIDAYDLLTLHPLEIGRQLTLLHFDLYRAIKPIELVEAAWTKHEKYRKSPQLLKLTDHSTLLTLWVSRSIVETESLEERIAMFNRTLEVMSVFEELHNFTGLVAFSAALHSSCVHRLSWCWERLDNEKQKCFERFKLLCDRRWTEMQKRLQSINPPCIPFFGHYLSNIYFLEQGNSTFVKSPGATKASDNVSLPDPAENKRILVSFLKCRKISDLIREIQIYQNEQYKLSLEPSIRQFFESINPKSDFKNQDDLETYLYEKSLKIQPKGVDAPTNDAKPKHNSNTLRSPGVKPPKQGNHYSTNHPLGIHHQTSQIHHSNTVPSTPVSIHEPKRSFSQNQDPETQSQFSMVDVRYDRKGQQKIPVLQPPPPPSAPRSRHAPPLNLNSLPPTTIAPMAPAPKSSGIMSSASSPTSTSTTPSSAIGPAPKLHPRRLPQPMSPLAKSPLTPANVSRQQLPLRVSIPNRIRRCATTTAPSPPYDGHQFRRFVVFPEYERINQREPRTTSSHLRSRRIALPNRSSLGTPSSCPTTTERIVYVPSTTSYSSQILSKQQQQSDVFRTVRRPDFPFDFR